MHWTSLWSAPVAPEPVKITTSSAEPPTAARMMLARLLAERGRLRARGRDLGVRVGVEGHHLVAEEVLDERERSARGRVVRIGDALRPVRAVDDPIVADHCVTNGLDERFGLGVHRRDA